MSSSQYTRLGEAPKRTSFSFLRELDPIFRDHDALLLYRHYLHQTTQPALAFHIDFYEDVLELEDSMEDEQRRVQGIYKKYFSGEGECILEIKKEIIEKVREDVGNGKSLAFEPAIKVVVRDLAFAHFNGFWESEEFRHYRELMLSGVIPNSRKQREKAHLSKFFGEEIDESEAKRVNYRAQPGHVKKYRLDRIFGEKSAVDYVPDIDADVYNSDGELEEPVPEEVVRVRARRAMSNVERRRSRRLHVFFGTPFPIDEVVYSEKVRSTSPIADFMTRKLRRQPIHVHPHRLNRFFGERVKSGEICAEDLEGEGKESGPSLYRGPRYPRTQRIQRFFGERMDPDKEANAVSFADQPPHVKGHRLRKIFGTPVSNTDCNTDVCMEEDIMEDEEISNQGGPPQETKRAHKLHKFFGTKVEEGSL